ncbi:MAG TPA: L,D-transpeptidase [Holophagaceae bacterium]|nr:L,D-transpeptidase [Holophagaceae bacterium]
MAAWSRRLTLLWLLQSVPLPASADARALAAARARLESACRAQGLPFPPPAPRILIEKGARRLTLLSGDHPVQTYRVGLGAAPELAKAREGDHRTPEGRYYVCTRNAASQFHLFLGVSYPNGADADRGEQDRLVTPAQAAAIRAAERRRGLPPQFTRLGGLVGIHGGGNGSDWTWGCIALTNEGIEELWTVCPVGTPVEIRK